MIAPEPAQPFDSPAEPSPGAPRIPHMSTIEFRALAHQAVDWVADYLESIEKRPVRSASKPGDLLRALPESMPAPPVTAGQDGWHEIFRDLDQLIMPGLTHWQSPNFHAYFPSNSSGPAIIGEILTAGLNVNAMLWATSPAATELETRMMDWLARAIDLPATFLSTARDHTGQSSGGGVILSTASEAALVAIAAARTRILAANPSINPDSLVAYTSTQAHSSITKACMIAGLIRSPDDHSRLRLIPGDYTSSFALRPESLECAIERDLESGLTPCFIAATLGTTSSGAFDALPAITSAMQRAGLTPSHPKPWIHVDAAWAGAAMICPEQRAFAAGLQQADSFCFNPHKWLLSGCDCDCFWTSDRPSLLRALSITPEYLKNQATSTGDVIDYRDWQMPLGKRFRSLRLWLVLRHYGIAGLQAHLREHIRLGEAFEKLVRADDRFELASPRSLSLICLRLKRRDAGSSPEPVEAANARNKALLDRINATGQVLLSHTMLPDASGFSRYTLRMAIGATHTQEKHIRTAWELIASTATRLD